MLLEDSSTGRVVLPWVVHSFSPASRAMLGSPVRPRQHGLKVERDPEQIGLDWPCPWRCGCGVRGGVSPLHPAKSSADRPWLPAAPFRWAVEKNAKRPAGCPPPTPADPARRLCFQQWWDSRPVPLSSSQNRTCKTENRQPSCVSQGPWLLHRAHKSPQISVCSQHPGSFPA